MPTLFIRVLSVAEPTDDGYRIGGEWLILENNGDERGSGVTDYRGFTELIDTSALWLQDPANVVLIIPSEHVLGVSCEVPGRNVNQIRKALPFVVEEFVATDIEGMHLAHGGVRRGEPVRCNLVDKDLLNGWRACFTELGVAPGFVVSEAELLPDEPDTVFALFDGDHVLLKTGDQAATVDRINLPFAVADLPESRIRIVNGELDTLEQEEIATHLAVIHEPHADTDSTLGYLANRWRNLPDTINLLQGDYAPPRRVSEGGAKWGSVGILAACWLALAFIALLAQGWWASYKADGIESEALTLYKDIFPADKRVTAQNLRRRVANRLGEADTGGSEAGFLELLSDVATTLDPSVELLRITYSGARSEISLDLMLQGYQQLERVEGLLKGQGLTVDIRNAEQTQDGAKVRANMRLSRG